MAEVIIVGRGLAAACLMHRFQDAGIEFRVIGKKELSASSRVAAGIWNPLVFKRLTKSWMADLLIPELLEFYGRFETESGKSFLTERKIVRGFKEEQEERLWLGKSKNELDDYLDPTIYGSATGPEHLINEKFGKVLNAGTLDLPAFLDYTDEKFADKITDEIFVYNAVTVTEDSCLYQGQEVASIIFCEGWLVTKNPFFNWVPFKPAKGEILTLEIPDLNLTGEISSKESFLFQNKNKEFRTGATYEWTALNDDPTEAAKDELLLKLKSHTAVPATLLRQEAGVRPATIDRRPVLGHHPVYKKLWLFNGLGTKGVMLAPYFSNKFVHFYKENISPDRETDLRRFYHLYGEKK
jgi:glycine oxidase